MKDTIVKNAADNFLKRYEIQSDLLREGCIEFLWKSIRQFRDEDPWLYENIYDQSSISQMRLLERRLEMEFIDIGELHESISNSILSALEKANKINKINSEEYLEEQYRNLFEDTLIFFSEDEVLQEDIKEKIRNISDKGLEFFFKKIVPPSLAAGVVSTPFLASGLAPGIAILAGIVLFSGIYSYGADKMFGVNMQKEQFETIKTISDVLGKAAKAVKKSTESVKHRYNIIFQNEERCYTKAGVDPKKLGSRFFSAVRDNSVMRELLFFSEEEKLDKLRNCYLEAYLDRISIFFELYFNCLRNSGKWNEIREMNDDKIVAMFRMKGGLYPACDEYRDNAVDAIRAFEDLIDFIFAKSPENKSKWMLLLNRYIIDAKTPKDHVLGKHRDSYDPSKRPQFSSPKYQRLGKDT